MQFIKWEVFINISVSCAHFLDKQEEKWMDGWIDELCLTLKTFKPLCAWCPLQGKKTLN